MSNESRSLDVFFYGLFMDEALLRSKGLDPQNRHLASLENFKLVIGQRATLVPSSGGKVHGVLFSLTQAELDSLYADASVSIYRPEAVTARLENGATASALCFNLPQAPTADEVNPEYAKKLRALAERIGLPPEYIATIA